MSLHLQRFGRIMRSAAYALQSGQEAPVIRHSCEEIGGLTFGSACEQSSPACLVSKAMSAAT
jgi:hypothetical protein